MTSDHNPLGSTVHTLEIEIYIVFFIGDRIS